MRQVMSADKQSDEEEEGVASVYAIFIEQFRREQERQDVLDALVQWQMMVESSRQAALAEQFARQQRIRAQIQDLRARTSRVRQELRELEASSAPEAACPEMLSEDRERAFQRYLAALQVTALQPHVPVHHVNAVFCGKVSVGKSFTVNAFMKQRLCDTGAGVTTRAPHFVGECDTLRPDLKLNVWDIPGDDSNFNYLNMSVIEFIVQMHILVIVFDDTVDTTIRLLRVAHALNKPVILLRNKIDNVPEDELPWRQVIQEDHAMLQQRLSALTDPAMCALPLPSVFGVSAANAFETFCHAQGLEEGGGVEGEGGDLYEWYEFESALQQLGCQVQDRYRVADSGSH